MTQDEEKFRKECEATALEHGGIWMFVRYPAIGQDYEWLQCTYRDGTYKRTKTYETRRADI